MSELIAEHNPDLDLCDECGQWVLKPLKQYYDEDYYVCKDCFRDMEVEDLMWELEQEANQ